MLNRILYLLVVAYVGFAYAQIGETLDSKDLPVDEWNLEDALPSQWDDETSVLPTPASDQAPANDAEDLDLSPLSLEDASPVKVEEKDGEPLPEVIEPQIVPQRAQLLYDSSGETSTESPTNSAPSESTHEQTSGENAPSPITTSNKPDQVVNVGNSLTTEAESVRGATHAARTDNMNSGAAKLFVGVSMILLSALLVILLMYLSFRKAPPGMGDADVAGKDTENTKTPQTTFHAV